MAYEVTATRRRPQRFEDLVGQEFVAQTFRNSIQAGRIAHAYLFSGPRGCGKTSTARILAKALNCTEGPTASPCGKCSACMEITAGSSLDVIEIDGASNNGIGDVRQIKDEVLFPPNSCRYKVYIIDEVHMLSVSAFNALLKTIEEPPAYVIFIFATTELQKVPATIKSRCQQFNFRLVPVEKVKDQLAAACNDSGIKANDEALYWIARESTGSMRDAYTLFDQVAAFCGNEITYEKIRDKLGLVGVDRLNELFELCVDGNASQALLRLDEYMQNGVSIEQLVYNCSDYLRSLLLIKSGITRESLLGQSSERFSKKVLDALSSVQLERAIDIFMKLYRDIRYSLSPRYEMELALSRLCWLKDYVCATDVKKALDAVKPLLAKSASSGGTRTVAPEASASVPQPTATVPSASSVSNAANVQMAASAFDEYIDDNGAPDDSAPEVGLNWTPPPPFSSGGAEPPENESAEWGVPPDDTPSVTTQVAEEAEQEPAKQIDISSLENVFGELIRDMSVTDGLISAALSRTVERKMEGDSVTVLIESPFEMMQIQGKSQEISSWLSKAFGRTISFSVLMKERNEKTEQKKLPLQVELLRDVFKGNVVE